MHPSTFLKLNALLRAAYGAGALLAPNALARSARMPPPADDARYFNALFGGRDLSVAAATTRLLQGGHEQAALTLAASCEVTDLLAWAQEARFRGGVDRVVLLGMAFSAVGAATCLAAAAKARR